MNGVNAEKDNTRSIRCRQALLGDTYIDGVSGWAKSVHVIKIWTFSLVR